MCRFGAGGSGSAALCVHALRHGVAARLLEAAAERSTAMDGECAHGAGAGRQRVKLEQCAAPPAQLSVMYLPLRDSRLFFRPDALGRIIGNLVLTNKKAQFVITHKLLLLQYKYEVRRHPAASK